MAKGIRFNKNRTFSQKQFHKHKRIAKKHRKTTELAAKNLRNAAAMEESVTTQEIATKPKKKLTKRQMKIMLREARQKARAKSFMEVENEAKVEVKETSDKKVEPDKKAADMETE